MAYSASIRRLVMRQGVRVARGLAYARASLPYIRSGMDRTMLTRVGAGAALGGLAGAAYGMASNNTSVFGGMARGAVLGASTGALGHAVGFARGLRADPAVMSRVGRRFQAAYKGGRITRGTRDFIFPGNIGRGFSSASRSAGFNVRSRWAEQASATRMWSGVHAGSRARRTIIR